MLYRDISIFEIFAAAQPSRNQNENLYGAQPPSAAGINLS